MKTVMKNEIKIETKGILHEFSCLANSRNRQKPYF